MSTPRAVDIIARKRDGGEVDAESLAWLVDGYLDGTVSEGQMAAFLMAGVLRGFSDAEARWLTEILVASGDVLDLSSLRGPTVDKHSTGGVGDGTTLLVAPLLASAGAQVVKLSGRGLGHTGGTLDKLEAIPGMRVELSSEEVLAIADSVGCVVAAQTGELVPADRELYALRDVTATVASRALIASSVMSKKIAAGADTIVLDVKTGDGAFMATREEAVALARLCVSIGDAAGRRCVALVTAMDQPLGRGIGNALEVAEAVELLSGPPPGDGAGSRLAEVALELATLGLAEGRAAAGADHDPEQARADLRERWASGVALETLGRMIGAQGGDVAVIEQPRRVLPQAPVQRSVTALEGGVVTAVPARAVGEIAAALGAGRARKGDTVDPAVGVELRVEVGDELEPGAELAVVHARDDAAADEAAARLRDLVALGTAAERPATVLET
ncbi:MAG TPA: thymidine phosphorylase, partial [Egibacteraceae bacterium]